MSENLVDWNAVQKSDLKDRINTLCEKWRPKEIGSYEENGKTVRVFEVGYGCNMQQVVK